MFSEEANLTPDHERLVAIYEATKSEDDAVQAREDIILMLESRGWRRFQTWLSEKRDGAFQQLREVRGTRDAMAESFLRWQTVDALFEDVEDFIRHTVDQGTEIVNRRETEAQESFLKEQMYGRPDAPDSGAGESGDSAGSATDTGY